MSVSAAVTLANCLVQIEKDMDEERQELQRFNRDIVCPHLEATVAASSAPLPQGMLQPACRPNGNSMGP